MSRGRPVTVARLRRASFVATLYFAVLWLSLAEAHRYRGALFVLGAGVLLGTVVFRWGGVLGRAYEPASDSKEPTTGRGPSHDRVEVSSALPELPERQRARFLGALGHELRNPLNSVTGFSDMLLGRVDGELNEEQERSVRTIRSAAERLLRLVSTVVDQAKLEAGTLRLQPQWVAPKDLITEAIAFVRSRAEGASVVGAVSEGLPRVFVDRQRTVHALVSLAVLVMRSSETDVSFRVGPPRRDQVGKGFVQFDLMTSIRDSTAATLAIVERLQQPLSRSDALGLEVAIARRVIETQGGRMWTEAGTAGSLRVCMTLPTSSTT